MEILFTWLTRTVDGAPALALAASFLWGLLSVLLSPCHLSGIPLIVGYLSGREDLTPRRAFLLASSFSAGVLLTIALIGVVTAALGRMMGDIGRAGNVLVAGIFVLIGLYLMDLLPVSWGASPRTGSTRRGYPGALILGLAFGLALGPCTFAYMAPILAVVFRLSSARMPYAAGLLLAYAAGHCSVLVLAGTATDRVRRFLKSRTAAKGVERLRRVCGAFVAMGGLYLLYNNF